MGPARYRIQTYRNIGKRGYWGLIWRGERNSRRTKSETIYLHVPAPYTLFTKDLSSFQKHMKEYWLKDFSEQPLTTGDVLKYLVGNWKQEGNICLSWNEVAQSCPTLWDPMNCSLSGSSVHGIFQARILEWVAISFSRGSSQPRDWTWVSCIAGRLLAGWATRRSHKGWPAALAGNRTRVNCLEGSYAHHYTDNAP